MQAKYTKGYKYQVKKEYHFQFRLGDFGVDPLSLSWGYGEWGVGDLRFLGYAPLLGVLTVKPGYAWDGPSGPTKDDKANMRASLEHDVLYQLMRLNILPQYFRKKADEQFDKTAKEDGMWWWRRKYYLFSLRKFAGFAADPKNKKKVYVVGRK